MRYSSLIKSISYLKVKANAADVLVRLAEHGDPMVMAQNGEAKAVLQDVDSFERTQKTMALLELLAVGQQDIEAGRVTPAKDAFECFLMRKVAPTSGA